MKKLFSLICATIWLLSLWSWSTFAQTPSFDIVLDWMYENWLTKYNDSEAFRPDDSITRWEAAKFVAQYAKIRSLEKKNTSCTFTDLDWYDSTLTPHIKQACFFGLLKGSNWVYRPHAWITEAEALTVVIRSLYGSFEETWNPRRIAYYNRWDDLWLITNETLWWIWDIKITRGKLGTRFYQAAKVETERFASTIPWQAQWSKYSKTEFDTAIKEWKQVALFFHAIWCSICHAVRDDVTSNISDLPSDVRIFEVDIDKNTELMSEYWVQSQTTFVFFDKDWNDIETTNTLHYWDIVDELKKRFN